MSHNRSRAKQRRKDRRAVGATLARNAQTNLIQPLHEKHLPTLPTIGALGSALLGLLGVTTNGFYGFFSDDPAFQLYPFAMLLCLSVLLFAYKWARDLNNSWIYLPAIAVVVLVLAGSFVLVSKKVADQQRTAIERGQERNVITNTPDQFASVKAGMSNLPGRIVDSLQGERARLSVWNPPELPPGCKSVRVTAGGMSSLSVVKPEKYSAIILGSTTIDLYCKSNRLYFEVDVAGLGVSSYRIDEMSFHGSMPRGWERNWSSNAIEIVDADWLPILQAYYKTPEHVVVDGVFPMGPGMVFAAFGGRSHGAMPFRELTNVFPSRKPIFKYPWYQHPGEYAN